MFENPQDVMTSINLDILRGEMKLRLDPPPRLPTPPTQLEEIPVGRMAKLEKSLETQMEEHEKWEDLTQKLVQKTKEMAETAIRLDTSLIVFRQELVKRSNNAVSAEEQLDAKREEQRRVIEKMERDQQNQVHQGERAQERADRAKEELEEKLERKDMLTRALKTSRSGLLPLEERVHDLQINLTGNKGMSDSQRVYYNAECQVEKDQRDRVLAQIQFYHQEIKTLDKEITVLEGKQGLFRDEQKRRTLKANHLNAELLEQRDLFRTKLAKIEQEVDTVRQDRDDWEEKTVKLAEDLEDNKIESAKLKVKVSLFKQQLQGIQSNVRKLRNTIMNSSVTSIGDRMDFEDPVPAPVPEPVVEVKEDPYVWRPPKREVPSPRAAVRTNVPVPAPVPAPVKKTPVPVRTVPKYVPPSVVKPIYEYAPSPAVVKVNHVSVKPTSYSVKPYEAVETPSYSSNNESGIAAKLEDAQRDLEHQKRFQKEHAIKMEQQFARLASKVEVLANTSTAGLQLKVQNHSTESQLGALKHQMQKDAMRDAHEMRQLLQQLSQQCGQLSTKLEAVTRDVHKRDQDNARMEKKLQEKEAQYFEQMQVMRNEMERQLERQQQVFADKMSTAMIQMEKLVNADRAGSLRGGDSMASLESLIPLDSSQRSTSRILEEDAGAGTGGFSMVTSGITVTSPLFYK